MKTKLNLTTPTSKLLADGRKLVYKPQECPGTVLEANASHGNSNIIKACHTISDLGNHEGQSAWLDRSR